MLHLQHSLAKNNFYIWAQFDHLQKQKGRIMIDKCNHAQPNPNKTRNQINNINILCIYR